MTGGAGRDRPARRDRRVWRDRWAGRDQRAGRDRRVWRDRWAGRDQRAGRDRRVWRDRWARTVGIILAVVTLALLGSGSDAAAASVATAADALPTPSVCSDDRAVLGAATCTRVAALLAADEQATTEEIAVLIVGSTGGQSIERYTTQVFNSWGIGKAGVDNGVLVVVAFDDRAMRIEVGGGLSARLPDGQAREIVGGTMLPAFRSGDYRYGVLAGLDAARTALGYQLTEQNRMTAIPEDTGYNPPSPSAAAPPYSSSDEDDNDSSESDNSTVLWAVILALGAGAALLSWLFKGGGGGDAGGTGDGSGGTHSSGRRSYRSFSSRSSSGRRSSSSSRRSGFGGGRSSGGGASGRW